MQFAKIFLTKAVTLVYYIVWMCSSFGTGVYHIPFLSFAVFPIVQLTLFTWGPKEPAQTTCSTTRIDQADIELQFLILRSFVNVQPCRALFMK